jgi:hypothetical protein
VSLPPQDVQPRYNIGKVCKNRKGCSHDSNRISAHINRAILNAVYMAASSAGIYIGY